MILTVFCALEAHGKMGMPCADVRLAIASVMSVVMMLDEALVFLVALARSKRCDAMVWTLALASFQSLQVLARRTTAWKN